MEPARHTATRTPVPATRSASGGCRGALAALAGCVLLALCCPAARADSYGQLNRFAVATSGLQFSEQTGAFGVDPTDDDVYVGEEVTPKQAGEPSGRYRILRFSPSGALLAESPALNPKSKTPLGIEGVAVDPGEHRVYVLGLYERAEGETLPDPNEAAAGTLYALNSATLQSAVPGTEHEQQEGVLAAPKALRADGKGAGEALLNPHGIAVDPATHDVVMLGEVDTGTLAAPQTHLALERVTSSGALLASRYVDPTSEQEPEVDSPVVTPAGEVLAARTGSENLEQIVQLPRGEEAPSQPPAVVFEFPAKPFGPKGESVSHEELLETSVEFPGKGAGLVLAPEGGAGAGVLYSDAEVSEETLQGGEIVSKVGYPGALLVAMQETAGHITTSERGWTGGANPLPSSQAKCALAEREGTYPLLGAGAEGRLFALDPASGEVVEFGPGGEGCPHAGVPAIEVSVGSGPALAEAPAGVEVTLGSLAVGGNVLFSEWNFGDGSPPLVSTAGEYQFAETHHTFSAPGSYTVTETIKTDDLATPELVVRRTLSVTATAPPAGPPSGAAGGPGTSTQTAAGAPAGAASAQPAAPGDAGAPPSAAGWNRAALAGAALSVTASGAVVVKVACLSSGSCTGALSLRTLEPVGTQGAKRKTVQVLASGTFALRAGQTRALALRLSAFARRLLARLHVLRARALIVARDASGTIHTTPLVVTLRPAKAHR
jgi:hypothetical protein